MKNVLKVLVGLAVLGLIYLCAMSIIRPMRFDRVQKEREAQIERRLKAIATLEQAYNDVYGTYADARHLQWFLQEGKLYTINAEGEYTDGMREQGISEQEAARRGLLKRDTTWILVRDSMATLADITPSTLFDVVGSGNKIQKDAIKVETAVIDQEAGGDTIKAPVFRASIRYKQYLSDLDPIRLQQKIEESEKRKAGFPGLYIGSLTEVKNTGSWE